MNGQHEIRRSNLNVRSVLLTALTMKGTVLYDMTPCSLVKFTDIEFTTCTFRAGECPVFILHHEDRINMLLRNIDKFLLEYTASHTARQKIHNAH